MKSNKSLTFLFSIICLNCFSQVTFEPGYFINNKGEKIDCLIKNQDWKNNPTTFKYKLSETDAPENMTINSAKGFGVNGKSKYTRFEINIDRSDDELDNLSSEKDPEFKKETLFLKSLIEGTANLYSYVEIGFKRYFYKVGNNKAEQLVYKIYRTENNQVFKNNEFRRQLQDNLVCGDISGKKIKKLDYKKKELIKLFEAFHKCKNSTFTNYNASQKRDLFNLNIRPGLQFSFLNTENRSFSTRNTNFGLGLGFRLGLETEFILPYNNNKWAVLIEPTFQYYKKEAEINNVVIGQSIVTADYKSIELPFGFRYYMFLNQDSKLFFNGFFVFNFSGNSGIKNESGSNLEFRSNGNFAFGVGYTHLKKYTLELRGNIFRDVLAEYQTWKSDYNSIALVFGFNLK